MILSNFTSINPGKKSIVCIKGTGESTSTGKGSSCEEKNKCYSSVYAVINVNSS